MYRKPGTGRRGEWVETPVQLELRDAVPPVEVGELLSLSRRELRREWRELPEPFYGLAYLVVARLVDEVGFEGLHALCVEAEAQGLDLVPAERLLATAGIPADALDSEFLAGEFGTHRDAPAPDDAARDVRRTRSRPSSSRTTPTSPRATYCTA